MSRQVPRSCSQPYQLRNLAVDDSAKYLNVMAISSEIDLKEAPVKQNGDVQDLTNGHANGHDTEDTNGHADVVKETAGSNHEAKAEEDEDHAEPLPEPGTIPSTYRIYRVRDEDGDWTWSSECPKDDTAPAEGEESAKHAIVLRSQKSSDSRKKLEPHSIIVQSPWIKRALGEILEDYPGVVCDVDRLVFDAPFQPFIHRWSELISYLERDDLDSITKEHMTLLVNVLRTELRDDVKAYEDYLAKGIATYPHVWMMFQPGSLVVSSSRGPLSVYELVEAQYVLDCGGEALQLECEIIEWSGSEFGRYTQTLYIPQFKGVERITDLPAFPLKFHPEEEMVKARLIERGRKFEALAGHHFKAYKGYAIFQGDSGTSSAYHDGRIIIDCDSFNRNCYHAVRSVACFGAKDKPHFTRKTSSVRTGNSPTQDYGQSAASEWVLSDHFRLLCNNRVRGYSLVAKKWFDFYVDEVDEIVWNDRMFDSLVLPEDQKELILALLESQLQNRDGFDDIVLGKGQGIVMLLSGPPGVGKTLTAERVAEVMRRPLHSISSGDLGTCASDLDGKLSEILDLVARWNAVLLLDECDVFLEARSNNDLERNAIVSIWLRLLEYYRGILIMSTNRADNIDAAFDSRIHISMQYPNLNFDSRRQVWRNFLSKHEHDLTDADIDKLAEVDLNGRQIKNVLKTSHLLARRKQHKLSMAELETVLTVENRRPEKRSKPHLS